MSRGELLLELQQIHRFFHRQDNEFELRDLQSKQTDISTLTFETTTSAMKISFAAFAALAVPAFSQTTTAGPLSPAVTPPWASTDLPRWTSVYNSLVSNGVIPSTLTTAPWPTGGYGPGSGPWGPGWDHDDNDDDDGKWGPGGRGGGGPGRWGGRYTR